MAAKVTRRRITTLLVERQLFEDERTATAWILAGKVIANGQRVDKPGDAVPVDSDIRVKGSDNPYVSRGGLKMAGALKAFGVSPAGRAVLDCGASTGGFTDCLLQHGAAMVYSVDVGHGQLNWKLRTDPRVVNLERTNISDVTPQMLPVRPTLAVADLSYLSLRTAIPVILPLVGVPTHEDPGSGELILLVKPLFEVRHGNSITSPDAYVNVLRGLTDAAISFGLGALGLVESPIRGSSGTIEFFLHLSKDAGAGLQSGSLEQQASMAVARATSD